MSRIDRDEAVRLVLALGATHRVGDLGAEAEAAVSEVIDRAARLLRTLPEAP